MQSQRKNSSICLYTQMILMQAHEHNISID